MTILEALSGSVNYPVDKIKLQKILIDQGFNDSDTYTKVIGSSMEFDLAIAALYVLLVTSANISEGDFQIAATDKSNYIKLAAGIYSKWGVNNPLDKESTISDCSHIW